MITISDMGAALAFSHVSTAIRHRVPARQGSTARRQVPDAAARPRNYYVRVRALLRLPAREDALTH